MSGPILANLNIRRQSLLSHINELESKKAPMVEAYSKVSAEIKTIRNSVFRTVGNLTGSQHGSLKYSDFEHLISQVPKYNSIKTDILSALKTCKNVDEKTELRLKGEKLKARDSGFFKNMVNGSRYNREADAAKQRFTTEGTAVTQKSLKNTLMRTDATLEILHTLKNDYSFMLAKDNAQKSIESDIKKVEQERRATMSELKEVYKAIGRFGVDTVKCDENVNTQNNERISESRTDKPVIQQTMVDKKSAHKYVRFADEAGRKLVHIIQDNPQRSGDTRPSGAGAVDTRCHGVKQSTAVRTPSKLQDLKTDELIKKLSNIISEEKYRAYSDDSSGLVGLPDDVRIKNETAELIIKMTRFATASRFCDSEVISRKTADRQMAESKQRHDYSPLKLRSESSIRRDVEAECARVRKHDTKGVFPPDYWK